MALPPVGEELLVKLQLEKEAAFTTRTASSGTKLSCIRKEQQRSHDKRLLMTQTCNVRLYAPPPTKAEFL